MKTLKKVEGIHVGLENTKEADLNIHATSVIIMVLVLRMEISTFNLPTNLHEKSSSSKTKKWRINVKCDQLRGTDAIFSLKHRA